MSAISGPKEPFFSVKEVAQELGVSERTVRRWICEGQLRAHRFGRIVRVAQRDLIRFLRSKKS